MCDFKPGDEVIYVGRDGVRERTDHVSDERLKRGMTFTVLVLAPWKNSDIIAMRLAGYGEQWFDTRVFRKVQPRDLSAWLDTSVPNTDALDKPRRTEKRERA